MQTIATVPGITLNDMFVCSNLTATLSTFYCSVVWVESALRSSFIIPSLMVLAWQHTAWMNDKHFAITTRTLQALYKHPLSLYPQGISTHWLIYSHICPFLPWVLSSDCPSWCWHSSEGDLLSLSLSDVLPLYFFYLITLSYVSFSVHPSLWTSVLIFQHPTIDVLDTEVCAVCLCLPHLSASNHPYCL